jgi:hypothetical protein
MQLKNLRVAPSILINRISQKTITGEGHCSKRKYIKEIAKTVSS